MINWYEALPYFWLPNSANYDPFLWPDYSQIGFKEMINDGPDFGRLISGFGDDKPHPAAWASWAKAFREDRPLRFDHAFHRGVANRKYESARYRYLVPAWRRAIVDVVGDLDDIEDQVSTILWVAEWVTAKIIPLPPILMNNAQRLQRSLDCAEKIVAGLTPFRFAKTEHGD